MNRNSRELLPPSDFNIEIPPVPTDFDRHGAQDFQSLLMHIESVRLLKRQPALAARAAATLRRWRSSSDPRTHALLDEWKSIIERRDWSSAVARTERGNQLR
ncbi:MAG: transcriptional regulator, family, partial [Rhizobacter sp.]|nr:transcriptional regulator, family [Rhizobacter sp.]